MFMRLRAVTLAGAFGAMLAAAPATAQTRGEPLPRFEGPICPGVAGMAVRDAEVLVGRIRENLESFGRRLAPESNCQANLIVMFTNDPQAVVEGLQKAEPWFFTDLPRNERERLLAEAGPTRALLRVEPKSRDGQPIADRENLVDVPSSSSWMAHSKIYTSTRNDIVSALILVDRSAAKNLTILQLADYATFRGLTRALPATAEARQASILSLFDGSAERPQQLTPFDIAFLGELYTGLPNIPGPMRELALEQATGVDIFDQ